MRLGARLIVAAALAAGLGLAGRALLPTEAPLAVEARASRIVVDKAARRLHLYDRDRLLKTYPVALGGAPVGHKAREGDRRTPEGEYRIAGRNAASAYHLSLRISYPDAHDRSRAAIDGDDPGGDIMIHGLRNGLGWLGRLHRRVDWTTGCIAVTDGEIEEIWRAVADGTPITIR